MISDQYLAGLIDGEGYVTIKTRASGKPYRELVVGVSNTYLPLLEQLKSELGGSIVKSKMYSTNKKQGYHWVLKGIDHVESFLRRVRPYLIIKAERVDLALQFLAFKKSNRIYTGFKLPDSVYQAEHVFRDRMVELNARNNHTLPTLPQ